MKKRLNKILIAIMLLIPCSSIAFIDFGSSSILSSILVETIQQGYVLYDQLANLNLINSIRQEMRRGVYDTVSVDVPGLVEREGTMADLYDSIPDPLGRMDDGLILGRASSYEVIQGTVGALFGRIPRSHRDSFQRRDEQALYSLAHASLVADEALEFSNAGSTLLDDLYGAAEGKATIRSAQADALQVQQLAQIEANQGLLISLQAQEVLGTNEVGKSLTELSDRYFDMLGQALSRVATKGMP